MCAVLQLAQTTLRLLEPQCTLDQAWQEEPQAAQVARVLAQLHLDTCPPKGQRKVLKGSGVYPAPTFAYCFPLLKGVLEERVAGLVGNEMIMLKCLAVISSHAQMREEGEASSEEVDEVSVGAGRSWKICY